MKKLLGWVAISILALFGYGLAKVAVQELMRPSASAVRAQAEEQFLRDSTMYVTLKRHFPEDYDALLSKLTAHAMSDMSREQLFEASMSEVSEIRRRYAPSLARASDLDLQILLRDSLQMHEIVLRDLGSDTCDQIFRRGASALPQDFGRANVDMVDGVATRVFEVYRRALDQPVTAPSEATADDWAQVVELMVQDGVTDEDLDRLGRAEADVSVRNLCPTGIAMFRAIMEVDGQAGHRLRANFVRSMLES